MSYLYIDQAFIARADDILWCMPVS